jgi:hypothetical protein
MPKLKHTGSGNLISFSTTANIYDFLLKRGSLLHEIIFSPDEIAFFISESEWKP